MMLDLLSFNIFSLVEVIAIVALLLYTWNLLQWRARCRGRPFPPGPQSFPFIGNMYKIPTRMPWVGYRDLCSQYGEMVYLQSPGQSILVLGSPKVIFEYLDKRSANTSDRPQNPLVKFTGADTIFSLFPYGQWWRRHKRAFWQHFHPAASADYRPIQRAVAHRFLYRVLNDPADLKEHIRYTFAASMMKIIYGNDVEADIQAQMDRLDLTQEATASIAIPGKYLAQYIPFLLRLPSFFLGHELRVKSAEWRAAALALKNVPFTQCMQGKEDIVAWAGTKARRSMVAEHMARISDLVTDCTSASYKEEEEIVKNNGIVAFEGGADTVFSTLQGTFLALSLYPEGLRKAQKELDTVVGPHRLPEWEDQPSLPYVTALVKESLRWHNVLPLAVMHSNVADDELRGYFIPAGTVLVPNTWACMRDPDVFEDPDRFNPDRFIKDGKLDCSVRDPSAFVFGYGRRICPGRHFAEAALFITVASALHVFDVTPPLDEDRRPIRIEPRMTDGLLSYPEDGRCTIKPRSVQAEALILNARDEAYEGNIA